MNTTPSETEQRTSYLLCVRLTDGDELETEAGDSQAAARARLASLHGDLAAESFVQLGDDLIVRSDEVRSVRIKGAGEDSGLLDSLKTKITGGNQMSTYGPEGTQTSTRDDPQQGYHEQQHQQQQRRGNGQGFADQWVGYGRRPFAETKPFFLTSEFLVFVVAAAGVLIAAATAENFDAPRAWLIAGFIAAAYIVSRGFAKSGTRDPNPGRPGRDY